MSPGSQDQMSRRWQSGNNDDDDKNVNYCRSRGSRVPVSNSAERRTINEIGERNVTVQKKDFPLSSLSFQKLWKTTTFLAMALLFKWATRHSGWLLLHQVWTVHPSVGLCPRPEQQFTEPRAWNHTRRSSWDPQPTGRNCALTLATNCRCSSVVSKTILTSVVQIV